MPILTVSNTEIGFEERSDQNIIQIHTDDALRFWNNYVIENPSIAENLLGLYSLLPLGRDLKARFAKFSKPKHLLSRRKSGCVWTPKGAQKQSLEEFTTAPIEYNGEQCPDVFYEDCLERLLGIGNQKRDLYATPEGRAIMEQLIQRIYSGLHDSVYDLATFANHPLITQSDTNNWYEGNMTADEWADFLDQQMIAGVGGHVTVLDALKTQGLPQLNVSLPSSDVQGTEFIGDVLALFSRLKNAAHRDFKRMLQGARANFTPVMLVTEGIFNAYYEYLVSTYREIPQGYQLLVQGDDGVNRAIMGVLVWQGIPVVSCNVWDAFSENIGVVNHRAVLTAPGNFGVAFDTSEVLNASMNGIALRLTQRTLPPYQGKVYMDTTFRLGSSIIDENFVTMASLVQTPA